VGTVPTTPTFAPGETTGVSTKLNQVCDVIDFWANPPSCSAYQSAADATVSGTWKLCTLQAELFDNVQSGDSPMHDNVVTNSRIVFRTPGHVLDHRAGFLRDERDRLEAGADPQECRRRHRRRLGRHRSEQLAAGCAPDSRLVRAVRDTGRGRRLHRDVCQSDVGRRAQPRGRRRPDVPARATRGGLTHD
jgi:hypothetical protein